MLSAIKLVISENGKLLDNVSKETSTDPSDLINSLEEFQKTTNEMITKLIEKRGPDDFEVVDDTEVFDDDDVDEREKKEKKRDMPKFKMRKAHRDPVKTKKKKCH